MLETRGEHLKSLSGISSFMFVLRFPPAASVSCSNPDRLFHHGAAIVLQIQTSPHLTPFSFSFSSTSPPSNSSSSSKLEKKKRKEDGKFPLLLLFFLLLFLLFLLSFLLLLFILLLFLRVLLLLLPLLLIRLLLHHLLLLGALFLHNLILFVLLLLSVRGETLEEQRSFEWLFLFFLFFSSVYC